MQRTLRCAVILTGIADLALAAGFFFQQPWALSLWPWPMSRLSNIFLSSFFAATPASILWIGVTGEWAAVFWVALNLGLASLGMGLYTLPRVSEPRKLAFAVFCFVFCAACVAQMLITRRIAFNDRRRTARPVRFSFALFAVLLLAVGSALVLHLVNLFPWPLQADQQVLYGWIFLGAACYFLFGLFAPSWGNAQGQLWGFLAYDLVLIVPFRQHYASVLPNLRVNLIVYVSVLIYSGILAVYYLFLNPGTRLGSSR